MAQNIFKGLGIALITPFTQDGEVDYKACAAAVAKMGYEDFEEIMRIENALFERIDVKN